MAEALDRQSIYGTPTDTLGFNDVEVDHSVILRDYTHSLSPRQVPSKALGGAVLTWLGIVYVLCYLVLPLLSAALGLHTMYLGSLILNTVAFVPMALITAALVTVMRPEVITSTAAPRDPVIAATVGSLLVWFGAHELSPALQSILSMPLSEMLSFLSLNILESAMVGMMLASFTRNRLRAFALGAAFQTLLVSLFLGWLL